MLRFPFHQQIIQGLGWVGGRSIAHLIFVAEAVTGGASANFAGLEGQPIAFAHHAPHFRLAEELSLGLSRVRADSLDSCERCPLAATRGRVVVGRADALDCGCYHAFINCTPIGMQGGPAPDGNPLEAISGGHVKLGDAVVFDTVYAPEWTPLLAEARSVGTRCVTGRAMFEEQARRQSERWTGTPVASPG